MFFPYAEVCNVFTSVDHLLIEILLSCPSDTFQIYDLLSMGVFVMLLMDYDIQCANLLHYHHMISLLVC